MAKRKKGNNPNVVPKSGESSTLADILSSEVVVRVISSHVQNVVLSERVVASATVAASLRVTVNLVDSATGQVVKTVSSLEGAVSALSEEVLRDSALPAHALQFFKTERGIGDLFAILTFLVTLYIAIDQHQSSAESNQLLNQIAQRLEQHQPLLSHSEPAPATPKKPSRSPSKPKTPTSRKNQKSQPSRRTMKKNE